jgi:gluconate 2-dehydrogenase gamma chain
MSSHVSRRSLLKGVGLAGMARALPLSFGTFAVAPNLLQQPLPAPQQQEGTEMGLTYAFFNSEEQAFIEAAVDRLIPSDDLGPGALEAGVSVFIDRQLVSFYGLGGDWYMEGPWLEGAPEQGYQVRLVPQEIYRLGIRDINQYCQDTYGAPFAGLTEEQQVEVLQGLQAGEIELPNVPSAVFFDTLFQNTVEGFFADPIYGGNRNKVGWRLVGFPGVPAVDYGPLIEEYYNRRYEAEPLSIADVQAGQAPEMQM